MFNAENVCKNLAEFLLEIRMEICHAGFVETQYGDSQSSEACSDNDLCYCFRTCRARA